jgi:quercetin dioxygenase-like cupin family protein
MLGGVNRVEFLPGLGFQPVLGERTMIMAVSFAPDTEAPVHAHAEEQITIVIEGELEFEIDGDISRLTPGMVALVPPFAAHGARTRERSCLEYDVFNPPRQALLKLVPGLTMDARS